MLPIDYSFAQVSGGRILASDWLYSFSDMENQILLSQSLGRANHCSISIVCLGHIPPSEAH